MLTTNPNSVWRSTLILSAWSCWLMWGTLLCILLQSQLLFYQETHQLTHKPQPSPSSPNGTLSSRRSGMIYGPNTSMGRRRGIACFEGLTHGSWAWSFGSRACVRYGARADAVARMGVYTWRQSEDMHRRGHENACSVHLTRWKAHRLLSPALA